MPIGAKLGSATITSCPSASRWRAHHSLSADEAVRYALSLGARKVVPIHFEGWAHFTEGREQAERAFAASEIAGRTHWLRSGETAVID